MDHVQKSSDGGEKLDEVVLPGFRFHPTDEELVGFYLKRKTQQRPLSIELIKQLDIYKHDPWDLPKMAATGEKEWYFYCPRDRKYRNSTRPNRVTKAGFWKATGTDRPVYSSEGSKCIGLKKSLVFYKGRAAKGMKTDWMMHEFRLPSSSDTSYPLKRCLDKTLPECESWAICRIFRKTSSVTHRTTSRSWISPSLPQPNLVLSSSLTSTNSTISLRQDQLTSENNMFSSMKPERLLPMQISSNGEFHTNESVDNSSTAANASPLFDIPSYYEPNKDHQHGMMLPPLMDVSLPRVNKHPDINSGDISCVLGDYLGNNNNNNNNDDNDHYYNNDNESCKSLEGLHEHLIIGNGGFFTSGSLQEELQGGMLSDFDRRDDLWDVVKSFRFPISAASDVGLL